MASQAQITANRRNARRSTGPRTAAGKRRIARNALKHGLRSKQDALPGENSDGFRDFCDDLVASVEPRCADEETAALRVARAVWARKYLGETEVRLLAGLPPAEQSPKLDYLARLNRQSSDALIMAIEEFYLTRAYLDLLQENGVEQTNPIPDRPEDAATARTGLERPLSPARRCFASRHAHSNPIHSGAATKPHQTSPVSAIKRPLPGTGYEPVEVKICRCEARTAGPLLRRLIAPRRRRIGWRDPSKLGRSSAYGRAIRHSPS